MNELQPIEFNNHRILTTQQLAESYKSEAQTLTNNFNRNKDRYIPTKHYFCLEGDELRNFRATTQIDLPQNINKLYLWTEKGALLHAKSLNTNVAWQVYDMLVETYFNVKEVQIPKSDDELIVIGYGKAIEKIKLLESKIEADKPKTIFADAVSASKTSILVGEMAKLLKQNGVDTGQNRFFTFLRENGYLICRKGTDYNMPTQKSMELGLFEIKETSIVHSDGHTSINKTPKVTGKGQQYFVNLFFNKPA